MKKLLTLLLTLVMAVCLINLNSNHTKAEDNDDIPNRIGPHSLYDISVDFPPILESVKKISFSVTKPSGMEKITGIDKLELIMGSGVEMYYNASTAEVVFYCPDGFVYQQIEDDVGNYGYFKGLNKLEEVDFGTNFTLDPNTKLLKNFFSGCEELNKIDNLNQLDTSNIEDFFNMFKQCKKLTSIDLSNFNTSKATNMQGMFYGCKAVESLDVSKFNTKNVMTMRAMFAGCMKVENLDVSHFNTSKVTHMDNMFAGCKKLKSLNLLNFDTKNVIDMSKMFQDCFELESLNLGSFDTSNTKVMGEMFYMSATNKLKTILVGSKWNVEKVLDKGPADPGDAGVDMFYGCTNLVGENGTTITEMSVQDPINYLTAKYAVVDTKDSNTKGYFGKYIPPQPEPSPSQPKDESCEKVIGPTWHWNNSKGICEDYGVVGTSTR